MIIIGCDPGVTGWLTVLEEDLTTSFSYKKLGEKGLFYAMASRNFKYGERKTLVVEKVWTGRTPNQASILGGTYGFYRCLAYALYAELIEVAPITWEKALGLIGKTKKDAKEKAESIFQTKFTQESADSALIAYWYLDKITL